MFLGCITWGAARVQDLPVCARHRTASAMTAHTRALNEGMFI
jgi:hypothetical protein